MSNENNNNGLTPEQLEALIKGYGSIDQLTRSINRSLESIADLQEKSADLMKQGQIDSELTLKIMQEQAKAADDNYKRVKIQLVEQGHDLNNLGEEEKKRLKDAKDTRDEYEASAESLAAMIPHAQNLGKALGFDDKWKNTWWGAMAENSFEDSIFSLGVALSSIMTPANLLGSTLMKIQESTLLAVWSFDGASASLAAASGQGTRYNDVIMEVSDSNRGMGVGMEKAAQAIQGLTESMSGFTDLSNEAAAAMAGQTARLERLGVAAQTTGKMNDQFMKGMGMTADQAMAVNNEMARAAMGVGIPVGKMAQEFENAMPQLAAWGDEAPKIFKKVAGAAKALGVEMSTLLGFAAQFDTFEGAASAVGKLNNILGGDMLNTYDMINASEEKRNELLLQSIESSGKSWKTMSRYEKMALANAAGITDMAEANNLFGQGLSVYRKGLRDIEANAASQAELEARTAAAVSVQEKLMQVFEAMAIVVQPIVNLLHSLMNAILWINDATGGFLVPVVLAAVGAFAAFYEVLGIGSIVSKFFGGSIAEKTEELTKSQLAAMSAATAEKNLASSQLQASLACDKETLCKQMSTTATVQKSAAEKSATVTKNVETASTNAGTVSQNANTASKNIGIIATLRLAAANTWATVKTWALIAAERAMMIGRAALAAVTSFFSFVLGTQATAQTAVGASAIPAAGGTKLMATALKSLGHPYVLLGIAAIGLLAIGMGLVAIGAGLVANAFAEIIKAFIKTPQMILPVIGAMYLLQFALMGLFVTMGVGAQVLAITAPMFLAGAIMWAVGLAILAPPLLYFSAALLVFATAMNMFTKEAFASMITLGLVLPFFAQALIVSAPAMLIASIMLAPAMVYLGVGFAALAVGLFLMTFAIPAMIAVSLVLPIFAASLLYSAIPLYVAAAFITPAAVLLSIGLAALGLSLLLFDMKTLATMALLGPALVILSLSLLYAAPALYLAGSIFTIAAVAVGIGLFALGLGLLLFDKKTTKVMKSLALSLILFSFSLVMAAPALYAAGLTFTLGAIAVGIGLFALGLGLKLFDKKTSKIMDSLAISLIGFSLSLFAISPLLYIAGITFTGGAVAVAIGLFALGLALKLFNKQGMKMMEGLTIGIIPFALALWFAAPFMYLGGVLFGLGALVIAPGLALLGLSLRAFSDNAGGLMMDIAENIVPFAFALWAASVPLFLAGLYFLPAALLISPALLMIAKPLADFAAAMAILAPIVGQLPAIAWALAAMGPALILFATSMIFVGIAASMPFFSTGIEVFKDAISSMATSFEAIPTEKAKAMGDFFKGLADLSNLNNVADVMWDIAWGVYGVAGAIATLPEEKAFALSEVVSSMTEAAVKVTPEKVESVTGLVEQAAAYADVQAKFKAPSVDAFVQALKQVNDSSDSKGARAAKSNRDIVLTLNGRELGRAVDVHLDDKHNLRTN